MFGGMFLALEGSNSLWILDMNFHFQGPRELILFEGKDL